MIISHILAQKGRDVLTIAPGATLREAVSLLGARRVGAVVVTDASNSVLGIFSERDVIKAMAATGVDALNDQVSQHMTAKVVTCVAEDSTISVLERMTAGRFRHMPVTEENRLAGIISIGDVVKARLDEMEQESKALREYITN